MKIVITSDTHMYYTFKLLTDLPEGDMFIHCGDWSSHGLDEEETNIFCNYLETYTNKFKYRIVVPGNHERFCEKNYDKIKTKFKEINTEYLVNDSIEIEGIKIWGSPYTPRYYNWAFQLDTEEQKENNWKMIPKNTDILITHGPPKYILDRDGIDNEYLGCAVLKKYVDLIQPLLHVFGHLHKGFGVLNYYGNTTFINASLCNEFNQPINPPIVVEVDIENRNVSFLSPTFSNI